MCRLPSDAESLRPIAAQLLSSLLSLSYLSNSNECLLVCCAACPYFSRAFLAPSLAQVCGCCCPVPFPVAEKDPTAFFGDASSILSYYVTCLLEPLCRIDREYHRMRPGGEGSLNVHCLLWISRRCFSKVSKMPHNWQNMTSYALGKCTLFRVVGCSP